MSRSRIDPTVRTGRHPLALVRRESQRRAPALPDGVHEGGPLGNERLTASTGLILLIALAALGVTTLFLGQMLGGHIFIGMLLIGPLALKLASTGYRFGRYYTRNVPYRRHGPPHIALRLLAPVLVLASVTVFASGVALLIAGPPHRLLLRIHQVSFIVWGASFAVHTLAYLWRTPRLAAADWRHIPGRPANGSLTRRLLIGAALIGGLILALATLPLAHPWLTTQR